MQEDTAITTTTTETPAISSCSIDTSIGLPVSTSLPWAKNTKKRTLFDSQNKLPKHLGQE